MIAGGFLPLPNGFLPYVARGGFLPPLTASSPLSTVTRDATSLIYTPATLAEWQTVLTVAGLDPATFSPSALWLMQEAAGNLADSVGAFTLTASGAPSYRQAVTGWSRLAVTFADGATGSFTNLAVPDLATSDALTLAYVKFPAAAPAGARNVANLGTTATRAGADVVNATGVLRGRSNANLASSASSTCDGNVHALFVQSDRTNSLATVCTEALKTNPVFSATVAGAVVRFGGDAGAALPTIGGGFLYGVNFHGAAARMSDAQKKTLLQTLGYSVAW